MCDLLDNAESVLGSAFLCLHQSRTRIRLKEPAIAGYTYNPSKPPFEKSDFRVKQETQETQGT